MDKNLVLKDQSEASDILKDLAQQIKIVSECVFHIRQKAREEDTQKGISILNVKCQMMIGYLTNLAFLVLSKLTGKQFQGNKAIDRLVEIRTVLEKIRPIDRKLKYQIDKLMSAVTSGSTGADDPLRFKANPDSLISKIDADDSETEKEGVEEVQERKSKFYAPPKLSAVYYEEDAKERQQRLYDRAKKRALSSSIVQELRREYDEGPEEIRESSTLHRMRNDKDGEQVKEYEEVNMIRLPQTKQSKHKSRQLLTVSHLSRVARFEDVSVLETNPEEFVMPKKKKRGLKPTKKGTKKSAKKKKRF